MACTAVSAITVYHYQQGLGILLARKYGASQVPLTYFVDRDTKIKFAPQEKNMLTVFSLVIAFSVIEIMLSVASARSCDSDYRPREGSQVFWYFIFDWVKSYFCITSYLTELCVVYQRGHFVILILKANTNTAWLEDSFC